MEERHKQINELITKVALGNPNITREQITRARAMYNGDTRSLKEIEAELIAYSENIAEKKNADMASKTEKQVFTDEATQQEKLQPVSAPSLFNTSISNVEELSLEKTLPIPSIIPIIEDSQQEPSLYQLNEMGTMLTEYQGNLIEEQQVKDNPKQLVKKQDNPQPTINESGYGNVTGLLTIVTILSLMTIIMAIFTIITN